MAIFDNSKKAHCAHFIQHSTHKFNPANFWPRIIYHPTHYGACKIMDLTRTCIYTAVTITTDIKSTENNGLLLLMRAFHIFFRNAEICAIRCSGSQQLQEQNNWLLRHFLRMRKLYWKYGIFRDEEVTVFA